MFRSGKILASMTLIACGCTAWGQSPFEFKEFSTTMTTNAAGHDMSMKMYRSGAQMRTDLPGGGYSITDLDSHVTYMVVAGRCMQMNIPQRNDPFATSSDAKIERTAAGADTVDGHACKVENVTVTPKNGRPTKMKMWEAQDLKGFPVKIETQTEQGPATILYKDVSFATPDASLFKRPTNCMQMSMPQGMNPE